MTQHDGRQPLYGPPPGWGRPAGESSEPYAVPQRWSSMPSGLPTGPSTYPMFWRTPASTVGGRIQGIFVALVGLLVATLASGALTSVAYILVVDPLAAWLGDTTAGVVLVSLAASALAFAPLVPMAYLAAMILRQEGRWLHSVAGRVRWGWALQCLAVGLVAALAWMGIGAIAGSPFLTSSGTLDWWLFPVVLILLLVTATGGEYMLRGVLNRGVASLVSGPGVGAVLGAVVSSFVNVLMSSVVFIYTGDGWGAAAVLVLGLLLAFIVWQTGGLEAAVAMSMASGLISYAPLFGPGLQDVAGLSLGLPPAVVRLAPMIVIAGIITLMARAQGVQRTASPDAITH
ncbi:CPBP family glutamic-type intramembrane protease [Tessaracoccus antarcticus]|nr:CPBP family glutamic-type intramembrane protease [Tessaracoccus antarcticus]